MEVTRKDTDLEVSQSHTLVNQVKHEALRTTKSSPHRNLELHHTRSFSEIYHLHPSITDLSPGVPYPKPKAIEALQRQEVRRPESVLEMSDISAQDSDDEVEEDIIDAQIKGDKAMKRFLESNISVPLDGALTSSSGSLQSSVGSDVASDHELIMASWENEGRESIASSGSSIEKHFLTPSGQLLYREQQLVADSLLDTKRLKLSPSNVDRPMSPLAKITDDSAQCAEEGNNSIKKNEKMTECSCGLYSKFQDMERLVNEYEVQYDEVVKRRTKQSEEIKILRKDNVNLHKEQNRLHVIIKESYKQDETTQERITKMMAIKEQHIDELSTTVNNLNEEERKKDDRIRVQRCTIERQESEILKYEEMFKDVSKESNAFLQALAKELGNEEQESWSLNVEGNKEAIVPILKKRRCSLQEDFKSFTKHVTFPPCLTQPSSTTTDSRINEIQNYLHDDFNEMTAECRQALSHVQQTGESVKNIQQKAFGLETMLLENKPEKDSVHEGNHSEKLELEKQLQDLKRAYNNVAEENNILNEDRVKWKNESDRMSKEHSNVVHEKNQLECEFNDRINALYEEKTQVNLTLEKLETDLKKRLENSYCEKTAMELQLQRLKNKYINTETKRNDQSTLTEHQNQGKMTDGQNENMGKEDLDEQREISKQNQMQKRNGEQGDTKWDRRGYDEVEDHLKQLSRLTETLNNKIENTSQQVALLTKITSPENNLKETVNRKGMLGISGGDKVLWEIKGIYQEHFDSIQHHFLSQKMENQVLKEQLLTKEREDEVNKCYMTSQKKTNESCQEDLRVSRIKCQELKKQLREVKDRLLITDTKQRMSLYFNENNETVNQSNHVKEHMKNVKVEKPS